MSETEIDSCKCETECRCEEIATLINNTKADREYIVQLEQQIADLKKQVELSKGQLHDTEERLVNAVEHERRNI